MSPPSRMAPSSARSARSAATGDQRRCGRSAMPRSSPSRGRCSASCCTPTLRRARSSRSRALDRLRRTQLVEHFNERFGVFDPDSLALVEALSERLDLRTGDVLFEEGDPGDAAYLVATGRLRATRRGRNGQPEPVGEIGRSELVGEVSLVDGEPRSASVHAVRDTHLIRFSARPTNSCSTAIPRVGIEVAKMALARARRMGDRSQRPQRAALVRRPADQPVARRPRVRARADRGARRDQPGHQQPVGRRGPRATGHRADRSRRGRRGAPRLPPRGARARPRPRRVRPRRRLDGVEPAGAASRRPCRARRSGGRRSHDRRSRAASCGRRSRAVSVRRSASSCCTMPTPPSRAAPEDGSTPRALVAPPRPPGIARGSRPVGSSAVGRGGRPRPRRRRGPGLRPPRSVRRARRPRQPIDMIGGTSIGAIMAVGPAMGWDAATSRDRALEPSVTCSTPPCPTTSCSAGGRITKALRAMLGDIDIADLWLPYFCVSTNLTRASPRCHDRGASYAVRASIAIPGVLPPVPATATCSSTGAPRQRAGRGDAPAQPDRPGDRHRRRSRRRPCGRPTTTGCRCRASERRSIAAHGGGPPHLVSTMVRATLLSSVRRPAARASTTASPMSTSTSRSTAADCSTSRPVPRSRTRPLSPLDRCSSDGRGELSMSRGPRTERSRHPEGTAWKARWRRARRDAPHRPGPPAPCVALGVGDRRTSRSCSPCCS